MTNNNNGKSLENWIWDAACAIRGAKDAPKFKDYMINSTTSITLFSSTSISTTSITNFPMGKSTKFS